MISSTQEIQGLPRRRLPSPSAALGSPGGHPAATGAPPPAASSKPLSILGITHQQLFSFRFPGRHPWVTTPRRHMQNLLLALIADLSEQRDRPTAAFQRRQSPRAQLRHHGQESQPLCWARSQLDRDARSARTRTDLGSQFIDRGRNLLLLPPKPSYHSLTAAISK